MVNVQYRYASRKNSIYLRLPGTDIWSACRTSYHRSWRNDVNTMTSHKHDHVLNCVTLVDSGSIVSLTQRTMERGLTMEVPPDCVSWRAGASAGPSPTRWNLTIGIPARNSNRSADDALVNTLDHFHLPCRCNIGATIECRAGRQNGRREDIGTTVPYNRDEKTAAMSKSSNRW